MSFQKTTVIIAIIMLILCLIFISISLYNDKYNSQYPPVIADCPDYWIDRSSGDGAKCMNVKNLGKSGCSEEVDFSKNKWQGDVGLCRKYKWARGCNLSWDGITNASKDPCDKDSDSDSDDE